ncbi:initiator tRNA phosphoribosyl transferase [Cutaneotrichosporon oleaginosum]|uniref:Initiator tRNA phosphoribosyl transferase n=1 Tax=Cutaneotrichosporon oleaginosum TaxID=879819 RepID=A0A0J1BBM9_9TREE|nr:initiator tRNA phosphoribosyl transferase [Cutaneotrichosporon oleaginosum]KLT45399.1 initiator tRNA phosphoribosyl transferase [Cutaneotrichosporon oleaginosum]TXT14637.1 hypothetical protein COLE_00830 [Cutaneotrichosporon oleaginosum]
MNAEKAVKKHAAQHDLFNRLHSIAADEAFVRRVAEEWFGGRFEVVANQRCGTWYCDPGTSSDTYAYFKSTDGHTLNWDFNLRRSNLALAAHAEEKGGFILVDSTRRGKRMPDGLSKTVPIWCAVVNRAIALRRVREGSAEKEWDTALYVPAQIVSPSERAQIEARLDAWADLLETSVLPLPELQRPLRPFFVHPSTSVPPSIPAKPGYTPIICLSASRWVNGGTDDIPAATRVGEGPFARTVAFDYVPGAGDDEELWGRGLKPAMYHAAKSWLLATPRDELPDAVDELIDEHDLSAGMKKTTLEDGSDGAGGGFAGATAVSSGLLLDLGPPIRSGEKAAYPVTAVVRIVEIAKPLKDAPFVLPLATSGAPTVVAAIPSSRAKGKEFLLALDELRAHVAPAAEEGAVLLSPGREEELAAALDQYNTGPDSRPVVTLSSAEHLATADLTSAKKLILPIAVSLLCSIPELGEELEEDEEVDKIVIADALHKLVALWPDGNPPRTALKRVNEFLMSQRHR